MSTHDDRAVLAAWQRNAAPWTRSVREHGIESRRLVTDRAIIEAVLRQAPREVLDLGCGEGWLARALAAQGLSVTAVDAVPALVDAARAAGGGERYLALTYAQIAQGALDTRYDAAVCNFSLIGEADVESLLSALPRLLRPDGRAIVQTLHPILGCGDAPYVDGWRAGSWAGCEGDFAEPAPWYFRTLSGWLALLARCGLRLLEIEEPLHPHTGRPASLILIARPAP
ncbi:methyltransferase domain-containing protein [Lysobacter sp. 5GHs7-4]|uniref:class I SAM-dependent methyltransferase n=1 Tax=Lysobacter sp. 5GHs7-4 TaxID=2904253 RepID=UPI001E384DFE|nr:methyltransferase domain-containing protein [Lysobacter sp. 5GHs7-4]UHQ24640.1 methyltransferase domain-containing protein [Lysobacter sp. 5GHs7-4]